nr:helix-turn-helix domain-containing protein [Streptomyces sp. NRRL F-2747]
MRYADGGGLTAAGRAKREAMRFEASELFGQGVRLPEVARRLRVSRKSAYAWHADWRQGGSRVQKRTSNGCAGQASPRRRRAMSMSSCSALNRGYGSRVASKRHTWSLSPGAGWATSASHQDGCFTWSMNPYTPQVRPPRLSSPQVRPRRPSRRVPDDCGMSLRSSVDFDPAAPLDQLVAPVELLHGYLVPLAKSAPVGPAYSAATARSPK